MLKVKRGASLKRKTEPTFARCSGGPKSLCE